jgi:transcriptional regulator with XRE-family HTH domain
MKLGEKIRTLRNDKKFSLDEVADRVQLEVKQLKNIEDGTFSPSLGVLIKLARVLGVRLGTFLDDEVRQGPVITRKGEADLSASYTNAGAAKNDKLAFFSLAREKADRHMEPFLVDINPGVPSNPLASSHEGEEFIYVLKGAILIHYGKDSIELYEGDSIYLDSIINHQIYSANDDKALLMAVVYQPV